MTVPNTPINFGWEYVWHCHILSHEENDMMRPMQYNVPRALPAAAMLGTSTLGENQVALPGRTPRLPPRLHDPGQPPERDRVPDLRAPLVNGARS